MHSRVGDAALIYLVPEKTVLSHHGKCGAHDWADRDPEAEEPCDQHPLGCPVTRKHIQSPVEEMIPFLIPFLFSPVIEEERLCLVPLSLTSPYPVYFPVNKNTQHSDLDPARANVWNQN